MGKGFNIKKCQKSFCGWIVEKLYLCNADRKERFVRESAFSPYSDCVNLDNLHITVKLGIEESRDASLGCMATYILSGAIQSTFIFTSQGSLGPYTGR